MGKYNRKAQGSQEDGTSLESGQSIMEELIKEGAQHILELAIACEIEEHIQKYVEMRDEQGKRQITRNGYYRQRSVLTGIGPVQIKKPRVDDRALPEENRFQSIIVPKYLRKSKSVKDVIPWLYLKGVSTGDIKEIFEVLFGQSVQGLSPAVVQNLKAKWLEECAEWKKRDLSGKRYAYMWADGIYIHSRGEESKMCILVLIGANEKGEKEFLAMEEGTRESLLSWKSLLLNIQSRGVKESPLLAIGDGGMGFWSALEEVYPKTVHQRCWVHKTANVLDKLPQTQQKKAKSLLHEIYMAEGKEQAIKNLDVFDKLYNSKYPKAVACLRKDEDVLFSFYDFPAEHWQHIRSTNVIESTFATIRHRTDRTKNCTNHRTALALVFKMGMEAEKSWRKLRGYRLIEGLFKGKKYKDGILEKAA